MKTNLSKKEKIHLTLVALLIVTAWFVPSIIKKNAPELIARIEEKTSTKGRVENKALEETINYLKNLEEFDQEKVAETLNIPESTVVGFKITNTVYNAQNAKFDTQIQILNSYLDVSLFLEKIGENWEVRGIKTSDKLKHTSEGIKLEHGFDWVIVPQEAAEGLLDSWVLQPKDKELVGKDQQLLFLIEDSQGKYLGRLTDCIFEEISRCSEETIGNKVYKTAEVGNMEAKVLAMGEKTRNLIIILPYGTVYDEGTEINEILKSITFE